MKQLETFDTKLLNAMLYQSEHNKRHSAYEQEILFYQAVRDADFTYIKDHYTPFSDTKMGTLSKDRLRNLKYHLIISIALITRFCMEGGMESEDAYTLSDIYIRECDECRDSDEISLLHQKMIYDFTQRMVDVRSESIRSVSIVQCIEYICEHLHEKIVLNEIASHLNLNPAYLSSLFKKEMGVPLFTFIKRKKVEAAENFLTFSNYSSVDISNYLSFSSHSYFIRVFKEVTGLTPEMYRKKYFKQNWKK